MRDGELSLVDRLQLLHEFHFELAGTRTIDSLCYTLVDRGRDYVGVDRMGLWFVDEEDPLRFRGSFGIDESGHIRDEREARVRRDPTIFDEEFFKRRVQYRFIRNSSTFDHRQNVVGTGDLIVAPMWNGNETIGALSADNHLNGNPLREEDAHLIALTARMVGHLVTIKRTEQKLEALATVDELTGLLNRRAGLTSLEQQIALAERNRTDLTVAFLDLDGLKKVNDTRGHGAGDRFIKEIAVAIGTAKRASDIACRMGGDEFMLILPSTSNAQAAELMKRLLLEAEKSETLRSLAPSPWFSYGLSSLSADSAPTAEQGATLRGLIHNADEAMYRQKRTHRNE